MSTQRHQPSLVAKIVASWETEPEKWKINSWYVNQFLIGGRRKTQAETTGGLGSFIIIRLAPIPIITDPAFIRLNPLATLRLFFAGRRLRKWHINHVLEP